jgi:hypothetical protein
MAAAALASRLDRVAIAGPVSDDHAAVWDETGSGISLSKRDADSSVTGRTASARAVPFSAVRRESAISARLAAEKA